YSPPMISPGPPGESWQRCSFCCRREQRAIPTSPPRRTFWQCRSAICSSIWAANPTLGWRRFWSPWTCRARPCGWWTVWTCWRRRQWRAWKTT
ncbi:hypothetical protein PBMFNG_PBMFNG_07590, partial [Dysosmobacter welbionis]